MRSTALVALATVEAVMVCPCWRRSRPAGPLSKTWTQRISYAGRQTSTGLGPCASINLKDARALAAANALRLRPRTRGRPESNGCSGRSALPHR